MERPLILVTNDDGVRAPGIQALAQAVEPLGEVQVVAPDREASACSHSLTIQRPLRVDVLAPGIQSVDGTPADCVDVALARLLKRRPSLVLSGINRGFNLGDDVFYSGTVGGAREACFLGIPAIAVSLDVRGTSDYSRAAEWARRVAEVVLERGLPPATLLNLNVPVGEPRGLRVTVQARRQHEAPVFEALDPRRRSYYWIEEGRDEWQAEPATDRAAVADGFVALTPLQTDLTAHAWLADLRGWPLDQG